jgi:lysophospholipid acyltransferase (LPLAT)-like uncharacterized protein
MDARAQRKARKEVVDKVAADREARGRNKKHVSAFRKFRRKVGAALIESLAPLVLRAIARTWRVERTGEPGQELMKSDRPWICTMWHGRMLTMMPIRLHCRRGLSVLVSPSDDGGLAKRALDKFGYRVVRGSLSKRGARAMREMHEVLEQGGQLVITPDGPRGPRHSINSGAAWLARATGAPILPCSVAMSRAWRFNSWDRMTIPKPFARVVVHYGDPVHVDQGCTDEQLEELSAKLRDGMIRAEQDAFAQLEVGCDLGEHARQQA